MSLLKTIHPDQLTVVGTAAIERLGSLRYSLDGLKAYRYCKATEAILQGDVVYQAPLTSNVLFEITKDLSDDIPLVAGVALYSIASGSYGWVQVMGYNGLVRDDNAVALKDALVGGGTDGECTGDDTSNKEHLVFGMAMLATFDTEDDNDSTLDFCAAFLHNCLYKP